MANEFPTQSSTPGMPGSSTGGNGTGQRSAIDSPSATSNEAAAEAQRKLDRAVKATHEAVDRAAGSVEQAAQKLRSRVDQLAEIEREWAESCRIRVREHPLSSIGIALTIGLLIGRLSAGTDR